MAKKGKHSKPAEARWFKRADDAPTAAFGTPDPGTPVPNEPDLNPAGLTTPNPSAPNFNMANSNDPTMAAQGPQKAFVPPADSTTAMPAAAYSPNAPQSDLDEVHLFQEQRRSRKKALKTAGITLSIVVAAVIGIYLAGVAVFTFLFFPNTVAVGADLSLKNSEDAHQILEDKLSDHNFVVVGQGIRFSMSAIDAGLGLSDDIITKHMHTTVNPWAWPVEIFKEHDISDSFAVSVGSTNLADTLRANADAVNATATQPINATIGYDADSDGFVVVPEEYGSAIDVDRLIDFVSASVIDLPSKIMLTDEVLVKPAITSDNPQLQTAIDSADKLITGTTSFTLNGQQVAALDADTLGTFVAVAPDLNVWINEDAIAQWAAQLADQYDTIGTSRSYTRPDGKKATVEGGDYGWSVDEAAIKTMALETINAGTPATVELPFNSKAAVLTHPGQQDWGARYIDVDLSEQHVRLYDDAGALIWESDCVSGNDTASKRTPTGVYYIKSNDGASTLRGFEDDGTEYESHVRYWMPFRGNAWGLHDADWRSSFGGTIYQYNGSHGCVNLPVSKAAELSGLIRVGDPVIVHY